MYYRDNAGCLGLFVLILIASIFLAVIFSPAFWIVVGIVLVVSAIRRSIDRRNEEHTEDYRASSDPMESETAAAYEGTDDMDLIEAAYETNAVDVDVEVTPDQES